MNPAHEMKSSEFDQHMRSVFEPHHYVDGSFIFNNKALLHGLNALSFDSMGIEMHLKEEAPYFSGKFTILEQLRKIQAVASMLAIAMEKESG